MELRVLIGRPQTQALLPAFENAKGILAGSSFGVEVFEDSEVEQLVDGIEDEYRAHEAEERTLSDGRSVLKN